MFLLIPNRIKWFLLKTFYWPNLLPAWSTERNKILHWNQNCLFINLSETTTFFNFYFWRELILANIVPVSYIRRQSLCSPKPILWRYNTNFFHHSFLFTKICTLCTIFSSIFGIIVCFYNFFISISIRHNVDIYSPKTYSTSRRIQAGCSWYTSDIINQGRKSS